MRRRPFIATLAVVLAGWVAGASAQQGATPIPEPGATAAGAPKPGSAQPAPPKPDPSPDFVPSETVSSGKPVSFPTDI